MKVASINTCDYGSTGKIMLQISDYVRSTGNEAISFSRAWREQKEPSQGHFYFGSYLENGMHNALSRITGLQGMYSFFATRELIHALQKFQPDILQLHNLHGSYINLPMLFSYIKKNHVRVVWTFHDCWPFTGKCPYFTMAQCDQWKTGCQKCVQLNTYPHSKMKTTHYMWNKKKAMFTGVEDMTIVTPSQWLADLVKESFLKEYPVQVLNNGIDLNVFSPRESDFRTKYHLEGKFILLGVAFDWGKRKGMDAFVELSKRLPSDQYQIVLVGTDDAADQNIPDNIIKIHKTNGQKELAEIYTAADVLLNPTREDNYPTVNMEALACGTPVITFETGGSVEMLDESCGLVVPVDDIDALEQAVHRVCEQGLLTKEACLKKAEQFDKEKRFAEYFQLYRSIMQH